MRKSLLVLLTFLVLLLPACKPQAATWREHYDIGIGYFQKEDYAQALLAYSAAIDMASEEALAYIGRGDTYLATEESEKALQDYRQALVLGDVSQELYRGLVAATLQLKEEKQAMTYARAGLAVSGDDWFQGIIEQLEDMDVDMPTLSSAADFINLPLGKVVETFGENYSFDDYAGSSGLYYPDTDVGMMFFTGFFYEDLGLEIIQMPVSYVLVFSGEVLPGVSIGAKATDIAAEMSLEESSPVYSEYQEDYLLYTEQALNGVNCAISFSFESPTAPCNSAYVKVLE